MAGPAKRADCEERRGTADHERLPTGNAENVCCVLSVHVSKRNISYFTVGIRDILSNPFVRNRFKKREFSRIVTFARSPDINRLNFFFKLLLSGFLTKKTRVFFTRDISDIIMSGIARNRRRRNVFF